MSKKFLLFFAAGIGAVALGVAALLFFTRGEHIELEGSIQKVRTQAQADGSTLVVADFRFINTSNYPFVVESVTVSVVEPDGNAHEGFTVPEVDARRLFEYYPLLGQKYNETLTLRTSVPPRASMDRMVAARFELPEDRIKGRKELRIRVEDVEGPVSEITEPPREQ